MSASRVTATPEQEEAPTRRRTPERTAPAAAAPVSAGLVAGQASGGFVVAPMLEVGAADDVTEVEADRVAERVVAHLHGPSCQDGDARPAVRRTTGASSARATVGREGGTVSAGDEALIGAARSGGRTLPAAARRDMEGAFGADFSAVRVHTGEQAGALNASMSARAFTLGNDIFFREGMPDTSRPAGARLLAHELTHVVQQSPSVHRWPWDDAPVAVSKPGNVTVRTGTSDKPVALNGRADAAAAFGTPMVPARAPLKRQDAQRDLRAPATEKPASFTDKVKGLFSSPKVAAPEVAAPTAADVPAPAPVAPAPSVAALPIANKGIFSDTAVDATMEHDDPARAAGEYEKYAGTLLQRAQTHDVRIETFGRFVEADHVRIATAFAKYQQLANDTATDPKKAAKKKTDLEDSVGADKLPKGVDRSVIWTVVLDIAEERTALATRARSNANDDIPLVDSVYEMARDEKKEITALTGGRSFAHAEKRFEHYAAKGDIANQQKHHRRQWEIEQQARGRVQKLGLAVREAHLSEGRVAVKAAELAAHKGRIEDAQSLGTKAKALGKTVLKAGSGAAFSAVTAGIGTLEEDPSARTGLKPVAVWTRLKRYVDRVGELQAKKPYGVATSFHAGLQLMNGVLREVRNIVGGLGLLIGLLGTALGPYGAPLVAVGVTLGLISLGITMFKIVLEAVLASWSAVTRAVNSNARNNNLLTAQARELAAEGLTDVTSAAATIGAPMATNAAFSGVGGLHKVLGPGDYLTNPGLMSAPAPAATAGLGYQALQSGMKSGTGVASAIGAGVVASQVVTDADDTQLRQHRTVAAPAAAGARPAPVGPMTRGDAIADRARNGPHVEPAWLETARRSEKDTRSAGIDVLLGKHSREVGQFHDKTQALMKLTGQQSSEVEAATKATTKAGKKDDDGTLQVVADMSAGTGGALAALAGATKDVRDPKTLMAAVIAELKAHQVAAGMQQERMP